MTRRAKSDLLREAAKGDRQFVTALARGVEILRCFGGARAEFGTMELAHLTGLPQPTVWRLCHTLVRTGYLALSPNSEKLRLGPGALALGYAAVMMLDVGEVAMQGMQGLADEFKAASSLATRDRSDMLIVRRATAAGSMLVANLHVGSRLPMATSSFGWAYLAAVPHSVQTQLFRQLADQQKKRWPELLRRIELSLETYAKRGYVLNIGAYHPAINAIAVPIIPANGGQILALNVGSPATSLSERRLEKEVAPRLLEVAGLIRAGMSLTTTEHTRGLPRDVSRSNAETIDEGSGNLKQGLRTGGKHR